MASRIFDQGILTLQHEVVLLEASAAIGTDGAVTAVKGSGIASISKVTGDGKLELVLQDGYDRVLSIVPTIVGPATVLLAQPQVIMTDANLQAAVKAKTAITIQLLDFAGAAANPAAACVLKVVLILRNSSLTGKGE